MTREILFRGKGKDYLGNPKWHYGTYDFGVCYPDSCKTHRVDGGLVDENTIGQYTGLQDKNGFKIFEGDVLEKWEKDYGNIDEDFDWSTPVPIKATKIDVATLDRFRFWLKNEGFGYEGEDLEEPKDWSVIGNIHDSPDLLK